VQRCCRLVYEEIRCFRFQWVCRRGYTRCRCGGGPDILADSPSRPFKRCTCETIGRYCRLLGRDCCLRCPCRASTGLDILSQPGAIIRHYPLGGGVGTVSHAGRSVDSLISDPGAQFIVCLLRAAGIHPACYWALSQLGIANSPGCKRNPVSSQRRSLVGVEEVTAGIFLTRFDP
ncbi:unnamed protein product, partial [marine sediment metagenome]